MKDHKRYTTHTTWCCSFINVIIQPASLKEGRKGQHDKSKSHQSSTNSHSHSHSHSHSQLKKNQESKKTQITNHHEQRILLLESHTAPNTDQRPSYIAFGYRNRSVRFPFVLRLARRDNTTRRVVTCALFVLCKMPVRPIPYIRGTGRANLPALSTGGAFAFNFLQGTTGTSSLG